MKFFVDTADVSEIRSLAEAGLVDGVTTNPSLIAKSGRQMAEVIAEICALTPGPVSAEVTATDHERHAGRGPVPARDRRQRRGEGAADGGRAARLPRPVGRGHDGERHPLLLRRPRRCWRPRPGATFISPFVGRLDDIATDGMRLIADILKIYRNYPAP